MLSLILFGVYNLVDADITPHFPKYQSPFSKISTLAYPNPFNESTTIFFSPTKNEFIKVKLYNNKGQMLTSIFEDNVEKGESYQFELDGRDLSPGTYYYTIEANGGILHQRIDLVR